jgi:hypothetical protein
VNREQWQNGFATILYNPAVQHIVYVRRPPQTSGRSSLFISPARVSVSVTILQTWWRTFHFQPGAWH